MYVCTICARLPRRPWRLPFAPSQRISEGNERCLLHLLSRRQPHSATAIIKAHRSDPQPRGISYHDYGFIFITHSVHQARHPPNNAPQRNCFRAPVPPTNLTQEQNTPPALYLMMVHVHTYDVYGVSLRILQGDLHSCVRGCANATTLLPYPSTPTSRPPRSLSHSTNPLNFLLSPILCSSVVFAPFPTALASPSD